MTETNNAFRAYPLQFRAIPQERIWGGHALKSWFGVEQLEAPIGEYWVLSGHPHATSVVTNGPLAGRTLTDVVDAYPSEYLGNSPQPRFPLLIKFLEAADDLSVQVHPDDAYAKQHEGDYGKTEAWYVLGCKPDGKVVYGHRFADKQSYQRAVAEGTVKDYLDYQSIQPGQVVFVPAQTLHALLAGTSVIEVQQTSDVTYRVYDWDRVDKHGRGRELHVDKAGDVLAYTATAEPSAPAPTLLSDADGIRRERLVTCDYFTLEKWVLQPGAHRIERGPAASPDVLIGVGGAGQLTWDGGELSLQRTTTVLVPTSLASYTLDVTETLEILRVTY
ncbi:mannose-6-phosphate isomerase [Alicyclobacillus contaminans]|uniref:type I phosphomannose isomerase catalytic subunit n=1 Tax=Alicyclobacillus contaminans TaxID=392016 RepID=UPI0003FB3836|nr:type I phosphomannose isomerase catalytic subunit [Alicyclobacillus contaminans]GMA49996.1 mannose-6-phosphate isomerase [Alicyclobacillus contaminans]